MAAVPAEMIDVSIVVPLHNEQASLVELHRRVVGAMQPLNRSWELLLVDDGSTDDTAATARDLAGRDPHVTCIELRRNFGQTAALVAGFDHARGRVVVAMDGDLQHDPAEIPRFLDAIDAGCDLVSGWRRRRADHPIRWTTSGVGNWLFRRVSGLPLHDFSTTFKAYRRDLLSRLRLYGQMHRFIPALASTVGARIGEIEISNVERPHGRSKYGLGLGRTFGVVLDLIALRFFLRYLSQPLRFFGKIGLACWTVTVGLTSYILFDKLFRHVPILEGHGPMAGAALLLGMMGTMFICTGLIGEMLVRIYYESTDQRTYAIRRITRADKPPGS